MIIIVKPRRAGGVPVTLRVHRLVRAADRARDARDWPAAAAGYRTALAADGALMHLWAQFGHALKEDGRLEEAAAAYREAVAHAPDDAAQHVFLADMLHALGHLDAALAAYRAALALAPERADLAAAVSALAPRSGPRADEIVLLQTCDPRVYAPMRALSARTALPYAERHGLRYQAFVGLKRGHLPWHATFNRIDLLAELVARDHRGWVLYMDADTWIVDQAVDLRAFLAHKGHYALIGAPAGDQMDFVWNYNIGVMLYNLGHPLMRRIIRRWVELLARTDLDADVAAWSAGKTVDDQSLFHHILQTEPEAEVAAAALAVDKGFFNAPQSRFIRQAMRAPGTSLEQRLAIMSASIAALDL